MYKPLHPQQDVPGVLWLHGGGYAIGLPEMSHYIIKKMIEDCNCVVVAPDYRLSIEKPYPAALDDAYDALAWLKQNAHDLGIRINQLMIGGESAGGGLTAALSLYARDKGEVNIAFQMPLYPMIDDRMTTESASENDGPIWNSKTNYQAWKLYLGELFGGDVPAYAAAARATDYAGLPPTCTYVGDIETFRDETIQYIENLRNAQVPVEFQVYKGCFHGFSMTVPNARVSKEANAFFMGSFHHAVEHYFADQAP